MISIYFLNQIGRKCRYANQEICKHNDVVGRLRQATPFQELNAEQGFADTLT